jgi:DNA-binding NarL/FixJ family response regulator
MVGTVGKPPLRVAIADSHLMFAEALKGTLEPGVKIIGIAEGAKQALDLVKSSAPDILLLALMLHDMSGIEAARQISQISPRTKIILVTHVLDPLYIRRALAAGALGYVSTYSHARELDEAIERVLTGQIFVSPSLLPSDVNLSHSLNELCANSAELTCRQLEVLRLVGQGQSMKEIAGRLGISIKTVEYHKASITDRLGIRTTAELTQYAVRSGLI